MTMTFAKAVLSQPTLTSNGMKAFTGTANSCVDLFYNIGASRGKNIIPAFEAAYKENADLACRIALWARDIRGGSGERKLFKDILEWLSKKDPDRAIRLVNKTPIVGRWDDILVTTGETFEFSMDLIKIVFTDDSFKEYRGLLAKWLPRKGEVAAKIRKHLGLTPKGYRKLVVSNTKVVETLMCSREWKGINYSHVPSVASARYQKAFTKHDPEGYAKWREALVSKSDPKVKINAGAVYPYDVIKSVRYGDSKVADAQWEALPNFVGDATILPLVDVSGSMTCRAGGSTSKSDITCLDVAVSLGLYLADKNKGKFKDLFLTFSTKSKLVKLTGNSLSEKYSQMVRSEWAGSTNLESAFDAILETAIDNNVPQSEMPTTLLIMSDMQFDAATRDYSNRNGYNGYNGSANDMIERKYKKAGYKMPKVVFWNLNASYGNVPAKATTKNVALVSGFSPSIVSSVLSSKDFTPIGVMMETISKERYDF